MSRLKHDTHLLSRRALLKGMGLAPLIFRPAPFSGSSLLFEPHAGPPDNAFPFSDVRLTPHYPEKSPLADVLRLVAPGSDEYITERYAFEINLILKQWSKDLKQTPRRHSALAASLAPAIEASSLDPLKESTLRSGSGIDVVRRQFSSAVSPGREPFLRQLELWLANVKEIETAEFEIYGIEQISSQPLVCRLDIRYDLVAGLNDQRREERVGSWRTEWSCGAEGAWIARRWEAGEETVSRLTGPGFIDITAQALSGIDSYSKQMLRGADHWRTILDGAIGMDVYGNNGVAAGDFDNDGFDDLYICQPSGLPNRLYRNRGDGTFEDVTEKSGVGVLDNTACALFADFQNTGLQDLLVVCGTGPLLFMNRGDGTFSLKRDAFKFINPPQGTFTHAALADYDLDGRLDIYFCTYMYYLGLDQYHYPAPYFDARNGPPNILFHNEGNSTFIETTSPAGLNAENNRYSFACAWGDANSNGLPDLFVANDFGSSQLYRNNGDGTFKVVSGEARVEEVGAGMGCCWCDFDNDGHQDVYVPSMWEAAGQRVSGQKQFHADAPTQIRKLYQRHAQGNALYRNRGDGTFENVGHKAGVEMGRWSWSADFWDFDHDGYSDLYVTNGYISAEDRSDLASFFWRQVVGKSPEDNTPSAAYEHGWNAINELVRSDSTWHGYARNVLLANNRDGTFSEVSGPAGLDFLEDSRTFVLADLDHDGRLEVILKNRNAPQLRVLHNAMTDLGRSVAFRLRGHRSNRDAIGTAVTLEAGTLRQTKYLQAGTGFLAQDSKELFFGLGAQPETVHATVRWPGGLVQKFENLPVNSRIELEEGSDKFAARPFATARPAYAHQQQAETAIPLPLKIETWLIDPLKAPEFSLPDLAGNMHNLREHKGSVTLLTLWTSSSSAAMDQLKAFHRQWSDLASRQVDLLAINVDDGPGMQSARAFALKETFNFPILMATEDVAGIYNIIYRHLFDRRRDMGIPTSFLIDRNGMIVKVYQGSFEIRSLLDDIGSIPATLADRMRKALPFAGELHRETFQRNEFTYGVAFFQHGYLDQAADSFQQAIEAKPDDPEGYYNLGTLNLRKGDFPEARRYLEQTVALNPNYPEAWNNLGMIAAQQGLPEEAIHNFRKSLELRPGYATALLNLGNVYRRQGELGSAQDCLNQALNLQPGDAEVNYSLGMLYAQQGQMQQASKYLQKAIDLRPGYPEALNNLGVLFVREQDYPKAEEQFKAGIRIAPSFDQSYLNLARLYAMRNEKDRAIEVLIELVHAQPQNEGAKQALDRLQESR